VTRSTAQYYAIDGSGIGLFWFIQGDMVPTSILIMVGEELQV
jgi:hypothetical protein